MYFRNGYREQQPNVNANASKLINQDTAEFIYFKSTMPFMLISENQKRLLCHNSETDTTRSKWKWWSSFETKPALKYLKKKSFNCTKRQKKYNTNNNVHPHCSKIKFLPAWKPVPALREKWEIMFRVIGLKVEHLRWPDGGDCSLDRQGYRCDLLKFENTKDILFFGPLPRWWRGNLARVMGQMLLFKVTKIPRVKETYHEELC